MSAADRLPVIATGVAIVMAVVGGPCSTNVRSIAHSQAFRATNVPHL